jgi:hypothetical protein
VKRQPFPVPYGLFIVLGVYAVGVLGYVWQAYWNSPEYLAAEHYAAATEMLGLDDGHSASKETVFDAYKHYLEAARLMPRVKTLHERVEAMRWRLEERGFKLDHDMQMRAEAVAMLWQRIQQEHEPILVVGARDRGWVPSQLLEGPTRTFLYSLPGAALIVVVWAYLRFSGKRVRERDHEAQLKGLEADVKALAGQRPKPLAPKAKTRR